jgi:endonuclease/exonuclease/phosphatase (EEP) superfamily protein YafD
VHLADGTPVRVSSMHLQHKEENTPTRLEQLDAAIADIVPTGPSILAGDLNARPGWPEIEAMEAAGWVSAIDAVGDPAALTFSTWEPAERIDWVFGQHVELTRAEVLPDTSSDHFAILVEANPAP